MEISASLKYTLSISDVATEPGYFGHTKGEVRLASGELIATVNRNYSSFPYLWVEGHPNGHDYLICGQNYQGQTVIELDTGKRIDFLPEEAKDGHGFCMADAMFDRETRILAIDGCLWACPYEYRFYDFSDPLSGWPELKIRDGYQDSSDIKPEFNGGTIKCSEQRSIDQPDDCADDYKYEIVATKTYRRAGMELVLETLWVSEEERARRDAQIAWQLKSDEEWIQYKATDSLYLRFKEHVSSGVLQREPAYVTIGQCFDGWCPHFTGEDRRISSRLLESAATPSSDKVTVDLEWGKTIAPVKLVIYVGKAPESVLWFDRSVTGMEQALDRKSVV